MGTCHAMGGHRSSVDDDGCGLGVGTNSKEMLGSSLVHSRIRIVSL